MRIAAGLAILFSAAIFGQEPAVERQAVWMDTVKQGDIVVEVRGLGTFAADRSSELMIPEDMTKRIRPGQMVSIQVKDQKEGTVNGKVARLASASNGMVPVRVEIDGTPADWARAGAAVDGTIRVGILNNVLSVGRPVDCRPEGECTLFKLDADGQHATRVKVQFGQASINRVQVLSGLQPGDQVILSDMSAHGGQDRLRVQ